MAMADRVDKRVAHDQLNGRVFRSHIEVDVLGLVRELLEDGRDDLARATPRCPEIEDGGLVAVDLQITPEDT